MFTGKRGGFGAMLRIMRSIRADPGMDLKVIASDMHLTETFGNTLREIRSQIGVDAVVDLGDYGDTALDRTRALARCVDGLAPVLQNMRPDILLLLGDRGETLAAAMCAVEMGTLVAHIQAGDISGGLDDIHRHAITKLAHLHFSQNDRQRERVIRLGEASERVWNTGAPYVDNIVHGDYPPFHEALRQLGLSGLREYLIVLQHPDTYRPEASYDQMRAILSAVERIKADAIVIYPCSDPGYGGVLRAIKEVETDPRLHIFPSIEALAFLALLKGAKSLVGNSSAGIIEAPYFRKPFILVGARQDGREHAANVIRVTPETHQILGAIEKSQTRAFIDGMAADSQPFGDGNACERIFAVLRDIVITPDLFRKKITY